MKARTALLTIVTGLTLCASTGAPAFAQSPYRYSDDSPGWRYRGSYWRAQEVVRDAYRDILLREPDRSGLRSYTDAILRRGWSEADVRRSLIRSDEYRRKFGRPRWTGPYGS